MALYPGARKQGARVFVIDPVRTRTARLADEWIAIRPGTDSALALAMMHVIIGEKLHDADYVERYTLGFDALAERVAVLDAGARRVTSPASRRPYPRAGPRLRHDPARGHPPQLRTAASQGRRHGGAHHRLPACARRRMARDRAAARNSAPAATSVTWITPTLRRPDLLAGRSPRTINMNRLGDALSLDPARIAAAHDHPRPVDPTTRCALGRTARQGAHRLQLQPCRRQPGPVRRRLDGSAPR